MGWVMMSERELGRIEVVSRVVEGKGLPVPHERYLAERHAERQVTLFELW